MARLIQEFRALDAKGRLICVAVCAPALFLLSVSVVHVAAGPTQQHLLLIAFALFIALLTGPRPVRLPGTSTVVSVSEFIIFLSAILQDPYHAVLLAVVDAVAGSARLARRKVYVLLNVGILSTAAFTSSWLFRLTKSYLEHETIIGGETHTLELIAFPLVAMAMGHYLVNISLAALVCGGTGAGNLKEVWREAFPWVPVTYLAGAACAGVMGLALSVYAVLAALLALALALPIPFIIYFTLKTYNSKVEGERKHLDQVSEIHRSILEALAMAIDAKDQTTHKHIRRVQVYARRLGEKVGMKEKELEALEAASLLHDIGKLGVPDYILNKPGKLTEYEFNKMKIHPVIGAEILSNVKFDFPVASYVRAHHERWDGCGYPDGLAGEDIPLGARILALVDHFDALHSDRPYRRALSREEAVSHIIKLSGVFFDPSLVKLFLENLESLDAEVAGMSADESAIPVLSTVVVGNMSAPAAGYAEEHRPLTEVALDKIASAHQEVVTLHDMARVLSSTLSLQDTVAIIASRISNLVPYSTCVVYLMDEKKQAVKAEHASGLFMDRFRGRELRMGDGITGWVVANHRPVYNASPMLDLSFLDAEAAERFKTTAVFPALKNGESIGAIALYSAELARYSEEHLRLLEMIMQPVSDALHNALLFERARQSALTDSLTGLPNMRAFVIYSDREITSAQRSGHPLSIVLIDLDDFKQVNDLCGHIAGDRVLLHIAQLIRRQLRESDMVARYGGDEFVALLPMTDPEQAGHVINRIQSALRHFAYEASGGARVTVTASIGAATLPHDGQSFEELLTVADKRMYTSKDELKGRPRGSRPRAVPDNVARIS